jgi:undecaprenyl pyrophosphate synthase
LYFFDHYWPDALQQDLHQAIAWYINQEPSIEESKKIFTQNTPV